MARSNESWSLGMMEDVRRINVAITRARRSCCLVGDSNTFSYDENYEVLLKGLRKKKCVIPLKDYQDVMQTEGFQVEDYKGALKKLDFLIFKINIFLRQFFDNFRIYFSSILSLKS